MGILCYKLKPNSFTVNLPEQDYKYLLNDILYDLYVCVYQYI